MKVLETILPGVLLFEPRVFQDERGFFLENFNLQAFQQAAGVAAEFVQDNHSRSMGGVLRGLHYQVRHPQGKLISVVRGSIFDVAVDLRRSSATFGQWSGVELSGENHRQQWIPEGFAHGFLVTSDGADVLYKTTGYYAPEYERCIAWDDPAIGIRWPLPGEPLLSPKDKAGLALRDAEVF